MKVSSLKSYRDPLYPSRSVLDEHPELLELVPVRWRANPVVIGALTGLCLMMSAYRSHAASESPPPACRVAPVFQHGDGRGTFGCIATNAPVFLSEDEARQVITEEAKKAGLAFAPDVRALPNVVASPERVFKAGEQGKGPAIVPFTLDGTDERHNVSYEYMSASDADPWRPRRSLFEMSSVYTRDTLTAASQLRGRLITGKAPGYVAVFYDPMTVPTLSPGAIAEGKTRRSEAQATSAEQLRAQVRDFIKWLKAQGVV
ncbi:MAG: hypothetical protein Q7T82_06530 [Armatimonadota bacterium]|nr:hypothetical protein [Armatimonadota bacterium]